MSQRRDDGHRVRRLPVVDREQRLMVLISRSDIVKAVVRTLSEATYIAS
ncbi:MAG: hypothetical protein ABR903_03885 [Thermodesulfovibrionales bacterium]